MTPKKTESNRSNRHVKNCVSRGENFATSGGNKKIYLTAFVSYVKQKACETACAMEWGAQNAK